MKLTRTGYKMSNIICFQKSSTSLLIIIILSNFVIGVTLVQDSKEISKSQINVINNVPSSSIPSSDPAKRPQKVEFRANQAQELIHDWSVHFGRDIHYGTQEATCLRSIRDQFDPARSESAFRKENKVTVVSIDWTRLHDDIVRTISNTMDWHRGAVEAIARASEDLAGNHTYNKTFKFDYVDVHRLQNLDDEDIALSFGQEDGIGVNNDLVSHLSNTPDENNSNGKLAEPGLDDQSEPGSGEQPLEPLPTPSRYMTKPGSDTVGGGPSQNSTPSPGEWQTPIRYLKLYKHRNFDDVLINTDESAVHVPVHIYPGDPQIMNGIAWSDALTKVFQNNFVRNPKLTNQYFASQLGFMRLFPAQKWQIAQTDPDLYDARMRPWYVAGASSRKDVIILVDSSGSMTGSRRDIAKSVVFEILDTLTDNDHFLILKFSDTIQQLGVPACSKMRLERKSSSIPAKNIHSEQHRNANETDIDSLYLMPATGRNIRHVKTNFTLPTSGIANFSKALITAFEILHNYKANTNLGSQCNQAIMLITDGSPSDFEEIFNNYNYPNAPVRVFTYLIGREAGDETHTKMIACHNRGYYTHVINLAEVRETVQQYIPVMARPLVLNGSHPITWTPAYGELTYQILTDWIWESKRRDKARSILAVHGSSSVVSNSVNSGYMTDIGVSDYEESLQDKEIESVDLFGYNSNTDCFWQTRQNDLLTTVVQPVYDRENESVVEEKFLVKNVWTIKETVMRTAKLLGVAAADMKINDIVALAPSHILGTNGYAILLTNNGFVMHHPDLRSILEPFSSDPSEKNMRILKPFFSSLDFTQVEHILNPNSDDKLLELRREAVAGLTGWRELETKRALDCQKRVQIRKQKFYYKPIQQFPFSFMIAIPEKYGSHRIEAQIEIKSQALPEKLTTYFTTSDFDIWSVHPRYRYCDGPSNNTITTLLDMFQRIEAGKLDDIQWRPESSKPPLFLPTKIVCDKDLVQSLVFDAVATFGLPEACGPPSPNAESSLLGMYGVRFSFVATRTGLTRVRHYDAENERTRKEAVAFLKKNAGAIDETFYSRTVDYNMLVNDSATLIQVPFNTNEKIRDSLSSIGSGSDSVSSSEAIKSIKEMNFIEKLEQLTNTSIYMIATQSIIVNEGTQRAVAGVTGVFYDYASFVLRFINTTNSRFEDGRPITKPAHCYTDSSIDETCDESKDLKCGVPNDGIDCLLIDNNGYIVVSEDLEYIGRHLKAYDPAIVKHLVEAGVFHEISITDHQSVCMKQEEKQQTSSAFSSTVLSYRPDKFVFSTIFGLVLNNLLSALTYTWTIMITIISLLGELVFTQTANSSRLQQQFAQPTLSILPNKTYLRPCEKTTTLYETRAGRHASKSPEYYAPTCNCENSWLVYESVPKTNLILLILGTTPECRNNCDLLDSQYIDPIDPSEVKYMNTEEHVCGLLERESHLYRKKLDSCFAHHSDEEHIKICGGASKSIPISRWLQLSITLFLWRLMYVTQMTNRLS